MKFSKGVFGMLLISSFTMTLAQTNSKMLYYLVRKPTSEIAKPPLLVLLHGVGSNEEDLFSLSSQLPSNFLIVSVRAPYTISKGSYKWYDVKFVNGGPSINPEQAEFSRNELIRFLDQLKSKEDFDPKQVFLGGFSQGAIMSWSVGLTNPDKIKGLIALSGRVLDEIKPKLLPKDNYSMLRALIIHGTQDHVLPIAYGRQSKLLAEGLGCKLEYVELPVGHQVTSETIRLINAWLAQNR